MKKLFVLLLALTVVAGAAFAEDPAPVFTGGFQTGLRYSGNENTMAVTLRQLHDGNNSVGLPNYAWLGVTYDGDRGGFMFQVASANAFDGTAPVMDYLYGYYTFLEGMIKFSTGLLNDYSFATLRNEYGAVDLQMGAPGFMLQVSPVEGIDVATFMPMAAAGVNMAAKPSYLNDLDFYAKYANADMGLTIVAGWEGNRTYNASDLFFGAKFTGIENMTLDLEVAAKNLGSETTVWDYITAANSTATRFQFTEYVKYVAGAATLVLQADEHFFPKNSTFGFGVSPDASYKLSDVVTAGLKGNFTSYASPAQTTALGQNWSVKPYANFMVGAFKISSYFEFADKEVSSTLGQQWKIGADFSWSF